MELGQKWGWITNEIFDKKWKEWREQSEISEMNEKLKARIDKMGMKEVKLCVSKKENCYTAMRQDVYKELTKRNNDEVVIAFGYFNEKCKLVKYTTFKSEDLNKNGSGWYTIDTDTRVFFNIEKQEKPWKDNWKKV